MDSERVRKAEKIKNLYESKEWRQEDIARELGIPKYVDMNTEKRRAIPIPII